MFTDVLAPGIDALVTDLAELRKLRALKDSLESRIAEVQARAVVPLVACGGTLELPDVRFTAVQPTELVCLDWASFQRNVSARTWKDIAPKAHVGPMRDAIKAGRLNRRALQHLANLPGTPYVRCTPLV